MSYQQQLYLEPSFFEDAERPLSNYLDMQLLLDSLTSGPRPNWALLQSKQLCSHELYLVRQQPSLLVGPLVGFMRKARLQHSQLELQTITYYVQRLLREAFAADGHSTMLQILCSEPAQTAPPAEVVERLCSYFEYPLLSWPELARWHREMSGLTFPDFISHPQASVEFFKAYPVQTWELLYNSSIPTELEFDSRNEFFCKLLSCGHDEAVLYLCESTLEFPLAKRAAILKAAYLTAVAVAEPALVRRLRLVCPIDCPAANVHDIASIDMLEYLETVYLNFHSVSAACMADRIGAAIDNADPLLLGRLLDLYPGAELDLEGCTDLLMSAGSVTLLTIFEARLGPVALTPALLETVGKFGCWALAFHLCSADASRADAMVAGAQAAGFVELASKLRARYPAAVEISND